jgi:hypothetical protein
MADEIAIQILSFIRIRPWCKYKDIQDAFQKNSDNQPGDNPIPKAVCELMGWNLIQVLDRQNHKLTKKQVTAGLQPNCKFTLSPQAVDIEDSLGITFGTKPHSVFGAPVVSPDFPPVFVLMPFAAKYDSVYKTIEQAVADNKLICKRADNFHHPRSIVAEIWSAINHASLIIAECTGKNPNVFYEIGIAHALSKNVILLAQSVKDIPFDVKNLRFIIYNMEKDGLDFRGKLAKTIKAIR